MSSSIKSKQTRIYGLSTGDHRRIRRRPFPYREGIRSVIADHLVTAPDVPVFPTSNLKFRKNVIIWVHSAVSWCHKVAGNYVNACISTKECFQAMLPRLDWSPAGMHGDKLHLHYVPIGHQ